jgi:hypothetical protein
MLRMTLSPILPSLDQQHQLGRELDLGYAGDKAQDQPAENQKDRVWDLRNVREQHEARHRHEQSEDDELEVPRHC